MASSSLQLQDQCDDNQLSSDKTTVNTTITSSQFYPKVRKTYTIKKQRQKWTEQEHEKFVEALKLHGRAWRHIEDHIGTKTAVQIRSHAQKFFSKVTRDDSTELTVEIPPPRPKRKPAHPYPRKPISSKVIKVEEHYSTLSVSEQEHQSPTSVLSVSESCPSPKPNRSPTRTLKLFGTTVLVEISNSENHSSSIGSMDPDYILIPNENSNQIEPYYPLFQIHRPIASRNSPITCLTPTSSSSSDSLGINGENNSSKEVESQNNNNIRRSSLEKRRNCCNWEEKGFVPYKRCVSNDRRIQLCL